MCPTLLPNSCNFILKEGELVTVQLTYFEGVKAISHAPISQI